MNQNYKILIADDEILWLNLIKGTLEKNGYQVYITTHASEVEQLAISNNVDLALLDINFPDDDGLTICNKLKSNPKTEHIAVIMLTAQGDPTDLKKGFESGANDYIEKQASSLELLERIKALLKAKDKIYSLFVYKNLFDNSPYPMMTIKEETINNINQKFTDILKYNNPKELINSNISLLIDEDEFEPFCKQLEKVTTEKTNHSFPYKFKCKDDNYLNLVVHMICINNYEVALYCNTFS